MSREVCAPCRVKKGEVAMRRRSALVAARAYGTNWIAVWLLAPLAAAAAAVGIAPSWATLTTSGKIGMLGILVACYVLMVVAWALICGATVYFAPRLPGHDLWFSSTADAAATLTTSVDRRRDALPGDVKASMFAAWPQSQGVGTELGEYVRGQLEARGPKVRVTLAAVPAMAEKYEAAGFVADGPQLRFIPVRRMASRPRPPEDAAD